MRIKAGSFGTSGRVVLLGDEYIDIRGDISDRYGVADVEKTESSTEQERHFGYLGFFIGTLLAVIVLLPLFGVLGALAGLVLVVAGSFYREEKRYIKMHFNGGKWIQVEAGRRDARELLQAVNNPPRQQ